MINPKRLIDELNKRENDSKRIDLILEAMANRDDLMDRTILFFPNGYAMQYDAEYKIFQVDRMDDQQVFKDGRDAIDYCISPNLDEESSDDVKADDNVVPLEDKENSN